VVTFQHAEGLWFELLTQKIQIQSWNNGNLDLPPVRRKL
jgi:hypothetical protein